MNIIKRLAKWILRNERLSIYVKGDKINLVETTPEIKFDLTIDGDFYPEGVTLNGDLIITGEFRGDGEFDSNKHTTTFAPWYGDE